MKLFTTLTLSLIFLSGCGCVAFRCESDADCAGGQQCVNGGCYGQPSEVPDSQVSKATGIVSDGDLEMTFAHVKPGEYSEIYVRMNYVPGEKITATLSGPGVSGNATQEMVADENGTVRFTWKIVSYGYYEVNVKGEGTFTAKTGVTVE